MMVEKLKISIIWTMIFFFRRCTEKKTRIVTITANQGRSVNSIIAFIKSHRYKSSSLVELYKLDKLSFRKAVLIFPLNPKQEKGNTFSFLNLVPTINIDKKKDRYASGTMASNQWI